jgi:ribosomal protein L27
MAAKKGTTTSSNFLKKSRKKRPGVHAKKGSSKIKGSKLYKKKNVGQG